MRSYSNDRPVRLDSKTNENCKEILINFLLIVGMQSPRKIFINQHFWVRELLRTGNSGTELWNTICEDEFNC
jgi:hypothetical protein